MYTSRFKIAAFETRVPSRSSMPSQFVGESYSKEECAESILFSAAGHTVYFIVTEDPRWAPLRRRSRKKRPPARSLGRERGHSSERAHFEFTGRLASPGRPPLALSRELKRYVRESKPVERRHRCDTPGRVGEVASRERERESERTEETDKQQRAKRTGAARRSTMQAIIARERWQMKDQTRIVPGRDGGRWQGILDMEAFPPRIGGNKRDNEYHE